MTPEERREAKRAMAESLAQKKGISVEMAEARLELVGGAVARKFGDAPPLADQDRDELMRKAGWS